MIYLVMGGQAGSEGKGEFVAYLSQMLNHGRTLGAVVRTGGPNAGHTMTIEDRAFKMRHVPCAWHLDPSVPLYIGPGSLIDPEVLGRELEMVEAGVRSPDGALPRVLIDSRAIIITQEHKNQEAHLRGKIGSTTEGIGAARSAHVMREVALAGKLEAEWGLDSTDALYPNLFTNVPVASALNHHLRVEESDVIVESTQGFDLSLVHSDHYPFVTSRDVTPGIILNDAGLSSRLDHRVISVIRTFPIRVAGNSGPMHNEVQWEEMFDAVPHLREAEHTTVTGNPRRIGTFDDRAIEKMAMFCNPDAVCLTFLDYLYPGLYQSTDVDLIRETAETFIHRVEGDTGAKVAWVSTGPGRITQICSFT